jgi:hypothetical protein
LIGQAFGQEVWKHAIIVFTHANDSYSNTIPRVKQYQERLEVRTQQFRREISQWAGASLSEMVPTVAIDNLMRTTPDGKEWLGELYVKVLNHISDRGVSPFVLATADRLSFPKQS